MTGRQLKLALRRLTLTHSEAARRLGAHPRTMRKWLAGDSLVPRPVALVVGCWRDHATPAPSRRPRSLKPRRHA